MNRKLIITSIFAILFLSGFAQKEVQDSLTFLNAEKPKIGVVLSGGGAKGFAHIATLQMLDSLGIEVDYIGGTSVGAIIGGLYAIGYSGNDLEKIVKSKDWDVLLSDNFGRANLDPEYRAMYDSYFFKFELSKNGLSLPSGVSYGFNFSNFLSELTLPVYQLDSFSSFDIPFVAVATNIVNGSEVNLTSGDLAKSIRASMAVPTFFTPVEIDSTLLSDGGLVNNFPVQKVIDLGADFIIGVDVQTDLYTKEQLTSLDKILFQSIFLNSESIYRKNLKKTDVLIRPNFDGYTSSDFSSVDSIYEIGKVAASLHYDELHELSKFLNRFNKDVSGYKKELIDSSLRYDVLDRNEQFFYIDSVVVKGLSEAKASKFLKSFSLLNKEEAISISQIQSAIQKELQRNVFDDLTFRILKSEENTDKIMLCLDVKEKSRGSVNLGIHYDSYFNAAALVNLTYRDALFSGMLVSFDARINENPRLELTYLLSSRYFSTFGFKGYYNDVKYGNYDNTMQNKIFETDLKQYGVDVFLGGKIGHNVYLGGGVEYEVAKWNTSPVYINDSTVFVEDSSTRSFNYYVFSEVDNRDSKYFPTKGISLNGTLKFITIVDDIDDFLPVVYFKGRFDYYIPLLTDKLTFGNVLDLSLLTYDDQKPKLYQANYGGVIEPGLPNFTSFYGLGLGQLSGTNGYKVRFNLQYEIFRKNYVSAVFDYGSVGEYDEIFDLSSSVYGYGFSYGYNSLIGPLEISLLNSSLTKSPSVFINLGLWF